MSYQQFPPTGDPNPPFGGPPPVVQQPAAPFAPTSAPAGRRTGLIVVGAAAAGRRCGRRGRHARSPAARTTTRACENLARAPVGCTTSLEFDQTGTFTVYVETNGSIGDVRGDCPSTDTDYEYPATLDLPDVDVVLTDESGDEVDLRRRRPARTTTPAAPWVGRSSSVDIQRAGDYDITVTSDDDDFAIAIGKNPKQNADSLRTNGIVAAVGWGRGGRRVADARVCAGGVRTCRPRPHRRSRRTPAPRRSSARPGRATGATVGWLAARTAVASCRHRRRRPTRASWPAPPSTAPARRHRATESASPPSDLRTSRLGGRRPATDSAWRRQAASEAAHDGDDTAEHGDLVGAEHHRLEAIVGRQQA